MENLDLKAINREENKDKKRKKSPQERRLKSIFNKFFNTTVQKKPVLESKPSYEPIVVISESPLPTNLKSALKSKSTNPTASVGITAAPRVSILKSPTIHLGDRPIINAGPRRFSPRQSIKNVKKESYFSINTPNH